MKQQEIPLHSQPPARRQQLHESFFGLFGGPIAWYVQLCVGYMLASESCYPGRERRLTLPPPLGWTRAMLAAVMLAAGVVALLALASSLKAYRRSQAEMQGDLEHVLRMGADRTCFLALWGVIFSWGFAVASVLTFLAYFLLPTCAG